MYIFSSNSFSLYTSSSLYIHISHFYISSCICLYTSSSLYILMYLYLSLEHSLYPSSSLYILSLSLSISIYLFISQSFFPLFSYSVPSCNVNFLYNIRSEGDVRIIACVCLGARVRHCSPP